MTNIEKIKAEIERRKKIHFEDYHIKGNNNPADYGACNALTQLLSFIESLEKESKVDLEKEIDKQWEKCNPTDEGMGLEYANIVSQQFSDIARYFFELGLKAQKGE